MTLVLILISSLALGWLAREAALTALALFSGYQQNFRLKNLVGRKTRKLPFPSLISFMEGKLDRFSKSRLWAEYFHYLSRQLQRMNRADLKAAQIMGYQILGGLFGGIVFGILSASPWLSLIAATLGAVLPLL